MAQVRTRPVWRTELVVAEDAVLPATVWRKRRAWPDRRGVAHPGQHRTSATVESSQGCGSARLPTQIWGRSGGCLLVLVAAAAVGVGVHPCHLRFVVGGGLGAWPMR